MSKIRRSIAERLVRAQQTMAMLTTFNEIDMTAVQELRHRYREQFQKAYGVSLGLMSFFARATVAALKQFPVLNARLEGDDILYSDAVHLGVAVSTERGLVVPVLRDVQSMSFARVASEIKRSAAAARDGKLSIQELSGGTFTITNGGVFGSLLSTPILHPPQSGILGLHTIQDRPVAVNRQVEIRPMMYVALTYDHRLVDGRDAVSFLVRLKQLLEDPMQMVLEI
jgi:2-oxoglutarate dehydrogenase E2 component (dihydrolipoamide succinyltransferase)